MWGKKSTDKLLRIYGPRILTIYQYGNGRWIYYMRRRGPGLFIDGKTVRETLLTLDRVMRKGEQVPLHKQRNVKKIVKSILNRIKGKKGLHSMVWVDMKELT